MNEKIYRIALAGNPNVGKSTIFNALTGLHQHTGNWTGKTVETAMGTVKGSHGEVQLIDLPGTYSLLAIRPRRNVQGITFALKNRIAQ